MLTKEEIGRALPANLKSAATQSLADLVNNVSQDPVFAQHVRDNFISYTGVLRDGKFKTEDYLNAVVYVSYQLMGFTNLDSYAYTFPQRYSNLVAQGIASKDIAAYVSAYNRGKLVNLVREQSLVPTWVLNADVYQKAINTQLDLMENATSEKVRCEAANSILTHLKKPEGINAQINLDMRDSSGITELKAAMVRLAEQQQASILSGASPKAVVAAPLIEGEFTDVTES